MPSPMVRPVVSVAVICLLSLSARIAQALEQPLPTAPSTVAATTSVAGAQSLHIKITGVEGLVEYRNGDDQPWNLVEEGMVLGENAELHTGPHSAVRFVVPPDQTITLDRLGEIKVLQAIQEGKKVTTRLGMKYGRTRYDIEAAGLEHDSTITSPSATLALRGTRMVLTDQRPFGAQVYRIEGRAEFRDFKKKVFFGAKGPGHTVVNTEKDSAAAVSLSQSVIDPTIALARTQAEANLVAALISTGATVEYDFEKGIKVLHGGQPPVTDAQLLPILPGRLNFVMRWTGNTDLNMVVSSPEPGNNVIYPVSGLNFLPSGGHIDFDHRGGPHGGIEIVSWPNGTVPSGIYGVGALFITGQITPATVDVFLDGKRVPIETGAGSVTTANFTGQPINPEIASGIFVGNVRLSSDQAQLPPQSAQPSLRGKPAVVGPVAPPRAAAIPRRK